MGRVTMNSNTSIAGGKVPKVKVKYDEGEGLVLDKGFCSNNKTRKSNPVRTKICLADPVVKKVGGKKMKLVGLQITQEPHKKVASSPKGVKRIRIDEVRNYFTESRSKKAQTKAGEGIEVGQQGILNSKCEVKLKRISIAKVENQLAECREKPLTKEGCCGNIVQALILKPNTIKAMLHNRDLHSKLNEGHEDDLFGQLRGQSGYGPLKQQKSVWDGKLISKEDSSGDESSPGNKSDLIRDQSPSRWSVACQPISSRAAENSGTPERSRWRNLSPVVLHTERHRASFQLRKLKERSKTEVNPRRSGQRSLFYADGGSIRGKVVERETGVRDQEKRFQELVAQVRGFAGKRENTPDSDCEKYFSDE